MTDSASVLRNIQNLRRKRKKKYRPHNENFYPYHEAYTPWAALQEVGPHKIGERSGLLHVIDMARVTVPNGGNLRVLEIGAGSGRLAAYLTNKEKIKPENYVILDKDYSHTQGLKAGEGWTLKRKIFQQVRKGAMKKIATSVKQQPPANLEGKFHLIILPFVTGGPRMLTFLLKNYFDKLEVGGFIVANRAMTSSYGLNELERLKLPPHTTPKIYNHPRNNQAFLTLQRQLKRLEQAGKIRSSKAEDIFFKTRHAVGKDCFLIQKIKD